jgi:LysM repeat protein
VLVGAAVVGGLTLSQNPSVASGEAGAPQSYTYVVAEPGDTLWQIARRAAPGVDPRVTIGRIRDLNALPGVDIRAGQRIALP